MFSSQHTPFYVRCWRTVRGVLWEDDAVALIEQRLTRQ